MRDLGDRHKAEYWPYFLYILTHFLYITKVKAILGDFTSEICDELNQFIKFGGRTEIKLWFVEAV